MGRKHYSSISHFFSSIFELDLSPVLSLVKIWSGRKALDLTRVESVEYTRIALQLFMPKNSNENVQNSEEMLKTAIEGD